MLGKLPSYHLKNPFRTVSKAPPRTHSSSRSPSGRQKGAGPAAGPAPIVPLSRCSSLEVFAAATTSRAYRLPAHQPPTARQHPARTATQHRYHRSPATASEPEPEAEPGHQEAAAAAGRPSAAAAAAAAHTGPWLQRLRPSPL